MPGHTGRQPRVIRQLEGSSPGSPTRRSNWIDPGIRPSLWPGSARIEHNRSRFITEAVRHELQRRPRVKAPWEWLRGLQRQALSLPSNDGPRRLATRVSLFFCRCCWGRAERLPEWQSTTVGRANETRQFPKSPANAGRRWPE
jgi:hypothetical protein